MEVLMKQEPVLRRSGRNSLYLSDEEVERALEAAAEAQDLGTPFNRMITILWGRFGVEDVQAATCHFMKALAGYLKYSGNKTAYIWVIEPSLRQGLHAHILVHVPPEMGRLLGYRQRAWLTAAGADYGKGLIRSKPIGGRSDTYRGSAAARERFAVEHGRALTYVLKYCSFEMKNRMRSPRGCQRDWVIGRRFGRSRLKRCPAFSESVPDPATTCGGVPGYLDSPSFDRRTPGGVGF